MARVYSDGLDHERRVIDILDQSADLSSRADLLRHHPGEPWAVRYHLAPQRAHLLAPFRFAGLSVLELGAGLGGATRGLAERARSVLAVEPNAHRLQALGRRLRDLDNWSGHCSSIDDLELTRRFDVVVMIGVLEYAERFGKGAGDPFDRWLRRAASMLVPGGVLLLAIENALGVKYWTGAGEDHSGKLFESPAGYGANAVARTFSRRELSARLAGCGLPHHRYFLPFPDYKLAATVIDDRLLAKAPDLAAGLATRVPFDDPLRGRLQLAPDELVVDQLAAAHLLGELANSFLVAACANPGSPALARLLPPPRELAWFWSARGDFWVEAQVVEQADGLWVEKRTAPARSSAATSPGTSSSGLTAPAADAGFDWRLPAPVRVGTGVVVARRLLRELAFADVAAATDRFTRFFAALRARFPTAADGNLDGWAVDATVANALEHPDGSFVPFDLEWRADGGVAPAWAVLRSVLALESLRPRLATGIWGMTTLADLHARWCAALGFAADLEASMRSETRFQAAVHRLDEGKLLGYLQAMLTRSVPRLNLLDVTAGDVLARIGPWDAQPPTSPFAELVPATPPAAPSPPAPPSSPPRVAAVVVHHGSAELLATSMQALLASRDVAVEAWVVANGPGAHLPPWLAADPRIRTLLLTQPLGFAAANNHALAAARATPPDYYLFLNNDALLRRDTLAQLVRCLETHPQAGIVGPKLLVWGAENTVNSLGINMTRSADAWDEGIGMSAAVYRTVVEPRPAVAVTGAAMLVRRAVIEQLGTWSELYGYYFEDVDFCLRARERGWEVLVDPRGEALHAISATAGRLSEAKQEAFVRNPMLLMLLHWPLHRLVPDLWSLLARHRRARRGWKRQRNTQALELQRQARRAVLRALPAVLELRTRRGVRHRRSWYSMLHPAGAVPPITLPTVDLRAVMARNDPP